MGLFAHVYQLYNRFLSALGKVIMYFILIPVNIVTDIREIILKCYNYSTKIFLNR